MQALFSEKDASRVEASFSVPFRPHLFGKSKPVVLNLSRVALAKDEVFLILVFIYGETKRQEKMVCRNFSSTLSFRIHDRYRTVLRVGDPSCPVATTA
jgi:hypothetical protein